MLAAGAAAWIAVGGGADARLAALAVPAAAGVGAALSLRRALILPWAVALMAGGFSLGLALERLPDAGGPVLAAVLWLVWELAHWSLEARDGVAWEREAALVRLGAIGAVALGGALVGAVALAAAGADTPGTGALALGAGAVILLLAMAGWLAVVTASEPPEAAPPSAPPAPEGTTAPPAG